MMPCCCRAFKLQLGRQGSFLPGLSAGTPTFHASASPVSSTHVHAKYPLNFQVVVMRRRQVPVDLPASVLCAHSPFSTYTQLPRTNQLFSPALRRQLTPHNPRLRVHHAREGTTLSSFLISFKLLSSSLS
jgi:hypothetical protein